MTEDAAVKGRHNFYRPLVQLIRRVLKETKQQQCYSCHDEKFNELTLSKRNLLHTSSNVLRSDLDAE